MPKQPFSTFNKAQEFSKERGQQHCAKQAQAAKE
jgi:hypothetical protein